VLGNALTGAGLPIALACFILSGAVRVHPARTDHQQNNTRRLQRTAAHLHHPLFVHALTVGQTINRHQQRQQNGGKRVTDELQPLI
jgi:hypothetical protein